MQNILERGGVNISNMFQGWKSVIKFVNFCVSSEANYETICIGKNVISNF